eukprot:SAG31_NODE_1394_length_8528_cov_24.396251_4_plen_128_part_00
MAVLFLLEIDSALYWFGLSESTRKGMTTCELSLDEKSNIENHKTAHMWPLFLAPPALVLSAAFDGKLGGFVWFMWGAQAIVGLAPVLIGGVASAIMQGKPVDGARSAGFLSLGLLFDLAVFWLSVRA